MHRFEIRTGSPDDLRSLLDQVAAVTGCRAELLSRGPRGAMGPEELITVLMTGGTGVALARVLNTWLIGRRGRFSVKRQRADGSTDEFTASGPDAREALESFLDHTDGNADDHADGDRIDEQDR